MFTKCRPPSLWSGRTELTMVHCNVTRITKLRPTVLEAKIINVLSDERCELWQEPSVSRNLVPQCLIFYQISQLVAIRDWYLPKFWCQPNGRRMSKFEIAICIPRPAPASSATFCPFQVLNCWTFTRTRENRRSLIFIFKIYPFHPKILLGTSIIIKKPKSLL